MCDVRMNQADGWALETLAIKGYWDEHGCTSKWRYGLTTTPDTRAYISASFYETAHL